MAKEEHFRKVVRCRQESKDKAGWMFTTFILTVFDCVFFAAYFSVGRVELLLIGAFILIFIIIMIFGESMVGRKTYWVKENGVT